MPKFDVAVVGTGLGGLAAAAVLSKKKKTIVFERNDSATKTVGMVEKDGFMFFAAPAISYGFEKGGAFDSIITNLGIEKNVQEQISCFQVALPDRRITVYPDQNSTLNELRREFPKEINALIKFYRDIHKAAAKNAKSRLSSYLSKHRTTAGFIRKYRFSRELMSFFNVQSLFYFQRPVEDLQFSSFITLCTSFPFRHKEGGWDLAEQMYRVIHQHAGEVSGFDASCELVVKGKRAIGIKTAHAFVETSTILLNGEPPQHPTTLLIALREEVVPVGMCRDVICLPDYARPHVFFTLSLSNSQDTVAPRDMRTLSASFWPYENVPVDSQALVGQISKIMPFLNNHVIFVEVHRTEDKEIMVPSDMPFKPLRSADTTALLFQGAHKKNLYRLNNIVQTPLQALSASQQLVKKIS